MQTQSRTALRLIILLGLTSLLGSLISNGAHSVTGPYLLALGGSAAVVGLVAGMGDFIGYALRLITGAWVGRHGHYWGITIAGYAMLAAIPFLAFTASWEAAALLIIGERIGKAIRSPSRDTILSHATAEMGRGRGFGLHKVLDQAGAIIGPLIIMAAFLVNGDYRAGFLLLAIPLVLLFIVLLTAKTTVPEPSELEEAVDKPGAIRREIFLPYATFLFLIMAGFANFPLISYHLADRALATGGEIPLLFSLAMLVSAPVALMAGRAYDRHGVRVMAVFPVLAVISPALAFSGDHGYIIAGVIIWGAALGMQETLLRATVADFTSMDDRSFTYGVMNATFGTAWFLGSLVMGVLYDVSPGHLITYVLIVEILSIPAFFWMHTSLKNRV